MRLITWKCPGLHRLRRSGVDQAARIAFFSQRQREARVEAILQRMRRVEVDARTAASDHQPMLVELEEA